MRTHAPARPVSAPRLVLGLALLLGLGAPLLSPPVAAQPRSQQPVTRNQPAPEEQRRTIGRDGPEAPPLVQQDRRSEAERAASTRPAGRRVEQAGDPTTALFAAINAGELDAVREAVAAGANVVARNMLGLTPIDLAVDLGRNDIAFYLMSQRRGGNAALDGGGEAMLDSGGAAMPRDPRAERAEREAQARAAREAQARAEREARAARQAAAARGAAGRTPLPERQGATPAAARTTTQLAPLWAGDGGSARPDAGFLGFNASRPAGARPPSGGVGPRSLEQGPREPAPRFGRAWSMGDDPDPAERRRIAAERRAREANAREQRAAAREARSGRVGTTSPAAGPRPASLPGTRTAPRGGVEAEPLPPTR